MGAEGAPQSAGTEAAAIDLLSHSTADPELHLAPAGSAGTESSARPAKRTAKQTPNRKLNLAEYVETKEEVKRETSKAGHQQMSI